MYAFYQIWWKFQRLFKKKIFSPISFLVFSGNLIFVSLNSGFLFYFFSIIRLSNTYLFLFQFIDFTLCHQPPIGMMFLFHLWHFSVLQFWVFLYLIYNFTLKHYYDRFSRNVAQLRWRLRYCLRGGKRHQSVSTLQLLFSPATTPWGQMFRSYWSRGISPSPWLLLGQRAGLIPVWGFLVTQMV